MKIGYARVSTEEQNLDLQVSALKAAGCERLFHDHGVSGSTFRRPGLDDTLMHLNRGDTLVVWRLDRLGRSLTKLVELIDTLEARDIRFQSLTEAIDTTSCSGMFVFHMMAALAQFERTLISERTRCGMKAARERGRRVGRHAAMTPAQCAEAVALSATLPVAELAVKFCVHPRTVQRVLRNSTRAQGDLRKE
ncbi:recombinase family protein [Paraburkholderia terrae]|jgi:DNA invertase Pin-like site-specific DNA recombinase|uniref:recombinase family protein n=1 Tax=Paraburkholderia terrae TaxID=311230 RepID=UPI001EE17C04|nr:recombinase family protein [Paraburkholderia terrae]GJH02741.1 recombinase family protein [Paraburkholderia terrae]